MVEKARERVILVHIEDDKVQDFTVELALDYSKVGGCWEGVCEQLGVAADR